MHQHFWKVSCFYFNIIITITTFYTVEIIVVYPVVYSTVYSFRIESHTVYNFHYVSEFTVALGAFAYWDNIAVHRNSHELYIHVLEFEKNKNGSLCLEHRHSLVLNVAIKWVCLWSSLHFTSGFFGRMKVWKIILHPDQTSL